MVPIKLCIHLLALAKYKSQGSFGTFDRDARILLASNTLGRILSDSFRMLQTRKKSTPLLITIGLVFAASARTTFAQENNSTTLEFGFFHQVSKADELCVGVNGPASSFAGWIGLEGDSGKNPKRSFFWYWHAEEEPDDAPIVLSMGGGPGSSGMMNALLYEAPCLLGVGGSTTPNQNRWNEKFNLLALDHCDSDDILVCYPEYGWADDLFNGPVGKRVLRVPDGVDFAGLGNPVGDEFIAAGDIIQPHHLLYEPLLKDGIRMLYLALWMVSGNLTINVLYMPSSRRSSRSVNPLQRQPAWRAQHKNSAPASVSFVFAEPEQGAPLAPASQVIVSTQLDPLSIYSNDNASTSSRVLTPRPSISSLQPEQPPLVEEVEEPQQELVSTEPIPQQIADEETTPSTQLGAVDAPLTTTESVTELQFTPSHPVNSTTSTSPPFTPAIPPPTRKSWLGSFRRIKGSKSQTPSKMSVVHMPLDPDPQSDAVPKLNDSSTSLPAKLIHESSPCRAPSPPHSVAAPQGFAGDTGLPTSSPLSAMFDQTANFKQPAQSLPSSPSLASGPVSPAAPKSDDKGHPTPQTQESLPSSPDDEVPPVVDLTLALPPPPPSLAVTASIKEAAGGLTALNATSSRFALTIPFFGGVRGVAENEAKKGLDSSTVQPITIESQTQTIFADAAQDSLQNAMAHSTDKEGEIESPRSVPTNSELNPGSQPNKQSSSSADESGDNDVHVQSSEEQTKSSIISSPIQPSNVNAGTGLWSYLNAWSATTSTSAATPAPSKHSNNSTNTPVASSAEKQKQDSSGPSLSDLHPSSRNSGLRQSDSRCKDNKISGGNGSQVTEAVTRGGILMSPNQNSAPASPFTPAPASATGDNDSHGHHRSHDDTSLPTAATTGTITGRASSPTPTPSKASAEPSHASDIRDGESGESTKPTNPDRIDEVSNAPEAECVSQSRSHVQEREQLKGSAEGQVEGQLQPDPSTTISTTATSWFSPWSWYSPSHTEAGGGVGPSVSAARNNENGHAKEDGDDHRQPGAEEDSGKSGSSGHDPAGAEDNREREGEVVGTQGRESDGELGSANQAQGGVVSTTGEQDTSKSNPGLENEHTASCHDTDTTLNPIEQSITSKGYRSGWASFFSSRKLMVKTLGHGVSGLIEDGGVERDEHGAEVMDVDFDDDVASGADSADGKDQKENQTSDGAAAANESVVAEEVKNRKSGMKVNTNQDKSSSSRSSSRNRNQPTAPPLTTSESVRQDVVRSNQANNKEVQSQSAPCSKVGSGSTTPTVANGRPSTPTSKASPTPDSSGKSTSPAPVSTPTPTATATTTNNKRTASPTPSAKSAKMAKPPPPPNLVLPTWEDTFHVPPRSITPPLINAGDTSRQSAHAHGYTASGGKLIGRAMGFVSGVLFSTPSGAANKGDDQNVGAGSDLDKNAKEEEEHQLSPAVRERKERFRYFGKELPRAWDVLDGQVGRATTASTGDGESGLAPSGAKASSSSTSKTLWNQSISRHSPWRFMAAMERDKDPKDVGVDKNAQEEVFLRTLLRDFGIWLIRTRDKGAVVRTVLGEPTGTSSKFVNMMVQALDSFQEEHGVSLDKITEIPLEGEGTIDRRVDKLYNSLTANQEWMDDLRAADAILVATHSQGSVVSTHLLNRLIHDRHIRTARNTPLVDTSGPSFSDGTRIPTTSAPKPQRVCCLALCGIHLGPLRYLSGSSFVQPYLQYFESSAARELFEFQNTESAVSKSYVNALRHVLDNEVKMVYVASLNDQVVPIYSGLFTAISHPLILRALYIDGDAYHSSDFLSNLLVLLLRILNSGISDSGLLAHLSEATAGSLSGVGHSTAYEELATYTLAVKYLFLTNDGLADHPKAALESFNASHEQNDYEIPWALRDVIADERVLHFFSKEIAGLRDAFRDWYPKTSILRDLKRKLQPIQKLPPTFYSGHSTSKL
ncbi:hypothetical protein D9756_007776 [Leucocoprinus leucothites]|uniref:YMC020W-like alpha/beta hydrolase domain-containing protein n=1 Tax=Leucocoprinus leucothites TaxID=201217 RepID=A0A8H5D5T8_9AGAR|nr:hypothetical protein D9756_007776 [Leucoagaricus leucothites]